MSTQLRILLVEDLEDDAQLLLREIQRGGYDIYSERVETRPAMQMALARQNWDLIICDYSLPNFNAPEALALMQAGGYNLPFIIVSGTIGEETAVAALKAGADDFLIKGNLPRLLPAIQRELRDAEDRHERIQRERELEAIASASMALRKAKTLNETLEQLLDQALAIMDTDIGSIWLYNTATDLINLTVNRGWKAPKISAVKRGQDISGLVVEFGKTIVSHEFRTDPRVIEENRLSISEGIGGACVPLHTAENVVGAMFVSVRLPRELTQDDVRVLNAIAEIGGSAIYSTRLHEQTIKQLERMNALRVIDQAISSILDLRVTLNILLEQIIRQLGIDAANVLLISPGNNQLEFVAGRGFHTHGIEATHLKLGEGYAGRTILERRIVRIDNLENQREEFTRRTLVADERFVSYFGVPLIAKGKVKGVLEVFSRVTLNVDHDWLSFLETLAGQTAIAVENSVLFQDLQRSGFDLVLAYDATIEGWSRALDLRDKETEGHTQRVTEMTINLARKMDMSEEQLVHLRRGSLLHDIGKMGVPDNILLKPGSLTDDEWKIMRQHPQLAYALLAPIAYLHPALDIPAYHHEKWDGTGYPRGLKGEQIPLPARIFAIADVWDAVTSDRPYRKAWSDEKALDYIREQSGTHFDPQVVDVFLRHFTHPK